MSTIPRRESMRLGAVAQKRTDIGYTIHLLGGMNGIGRGEEIGLQGIIEIGERNMITDDPGYELYVEEFCS